MALSRPPGTDSATSGHAANGVPPGGAPGRSHRRLSDCTQVASRMKEIGTTGLPVGEEGEDGGLRSVRPWRGVVGLGSIIHLEHRLDPHQPLAYVAEALVHFGEALVHLG